jgi:GxxExxY protein
VAGYILGKSGLTGVEVFNISHRDSRRFTQRTQNMEENKITYEIIGAALKVLTKLGPGLLESVYENALAYELRKAGHEVKNQVGIPVDYEEIRFDIGFRLDILVDDLVIIEVKSVDSIADVHHKQLLTYLRLTGKRVGLLINFNSSRLKDAIVRIIN